MSIRFKCSNGHEMNVKDKYAGMAGLCPTCQVRVTVPMAVPVPVLSDDAIVDMLGPPPAVDDVNDVPIHQDARYLPGRFEDNTSGASLLGASQLDRGMKRCPKCKREVRAVYDICPNCRTYFTDVTEISRRMVTACKQCGTENEHHLSWCKDCGADLRLQR